MEEADENLVPLECRWNLSGTYGVAKAFSKLSANARFFIQDDGAKLTISIRHLAQSAEANTSEKDGADALETMEFARTPKGIIYQKIERFLLDGQQECLVPFTAKIVSCNRGELTVELDLQAKVSKTCDVIERTAPVHLRLVRRNAPQSPYGTLGEGTDGKH